MIKGRETHQSGKWTGDSLEPYRRLLETQRQLVQMARKHEETKREYHRLRELLAREVVKRPATARILRHRARQLFSRIMNRNQRIATAEPTFTELNGKQPISC